MPTIVVKPAAAVRFSVMVGAPVVDPSAGGVGTVVIDQLNPGYILGSKKRQEVGSQAEPAFRQLPIELHTTGVAGNVTLTLVEDTDNIDPKTGLRRFFLNITKTSNGLLIQQEVITFDPELSTTTFTGGTGGASFGPTIFTPAAHSAGDLFQFGSRKQPDLAVSGFFAAD